MRSTADMQARLFLLAFAAAACAPRGHATVGTPAPVPASVQPASVQPASAAPSPACAAHRAAVRRDYCEDEPDCEAAELPCVQTLDLDADGAPDEVALASHEGMLVFEVHFGHGGSEVVGATATSTVHYLEPDEPSWTTEPDWSWLMHWAPAARDGEAVVMGARRFDPVPGRGDGLLVSGGDAAAMLVLTDAGWLLVELGF